MKKEFILNVALRGFKKGKILSLECNEEGIPIDSYWYRRFRDSKVDACISQVLKNSRKEEKK